MELALCGIGESELNSTYLKWLFLHHILLHMYVSSDVYWVTMGFGNTPVLLPGNPIDGGPWKAAVHGVAERHTGLSNFTFTFHFHALEKEMATHSSVLAWRIPGTGEPAGLLSMGSHRVRHDWSDLAAAVILLALYLQKYILLKVYVFN